MDFRGKKYIKKNTLQRNCRSLGLVFLCAWGLVQTGQAKVLESFAPIAERAIPGVVNIRTKTYVRKDPALDLYQFFLGGRIPQGASTTSLGSGVIIDSQGHIVTNYHVIKGSSVIEILFANTKMMSQAQVVGIDPKSDLALLKVRVKHPLSPLTLGESHSLRVGDIVLTIGNPFGYSYTVSHGIVSAIGRVIGTGPYDNYLQTDALIHPGNSGGPLLDVRGRVIGINTAVSAQGPGIGFALPIDQVKTIVQDLLKYGKVRRPWLGLVGRNILSHEDVEHYVEQSGIYGVIVGNLIIDGPGHKGGLKIGDLIMAWNGEKVFDLNILQKLLIHKKAGDRVQLKIYRRGRGYMSLNLILEEAPQSEDLPEDEDLF